MFIFNGIDRETQWIKFWMWVIAFNSKFEQRQKLSDIIPLDSELKKHKKSIFWNALLCINLSLIRTIATPLNGIPEFKLSSEANVTNLILYSQNISIKRWS